VDSAHSRKPKQSRSRESFDRVIEAATELLRERGAQTLTLAEVSRRSKVSIGSIYCRVESKDDLIRVVHARALGNMEHEFAAIINGIRRKRLPLRDLVPLLVRELAQYLRRHADLLSAFIERGAQDPVIASVGRKAHAQTALDFRLLLLERQNEFVHPDPERAAATCFTIVYGALARYLGLGGNRESGAGEGDWKQLIDDLGLMSLAFLATDLEQIMGASASSAARQKRA
jgi:AcrR family transcriptional regulator